MKINKEVLETLGVVIIVIVMAWLVYDSIYSDGFDDGMRRGVAYQKCMDVEDVCTKELVDTVYYPEEERVWAYMYPIVVTVGVEMEREER